MSKALALEMRMRIGPGRAQTEMLRRGARVLMCVIVEVVDHIAIELRRDITGQLAALDLILIRVHRAAFDLEPALGVDRMRDVGMKLQAGAAHLLALHFHAAIFVEALSAVIAEAGA